MATVRRFEDLNSWKSARKMTNVIYDVSADGPFTRDLDLRRQIRRAAGSAMHNIAEGFDAGSDAEFKRFLRMARRSASEVQSQLYLALDRHYITAEQHHTAYQLTTEVKRLINGLIGYLNKNPQLPKKQPTDKRTD
ncbi:MAG: four helix bundle protein [Anaerolineales bacterium]|nr:four helix bundle protein [Anaerolineales bacterium]